MFLVLGQDLLNPFFLPLVTTSRDLSVDTCANSDVTRDSWRAELMHRDVTIVNHLGDF